MRRTTAPTRLALKIRLPLLNRPRITLSLQNCTGALFNRFALRNIGIRSGTLAVQTFWLRDQMAASHDDLVNRSLHAIVLVSELPLLDASFDKEVVTFVERCRHR